MLLTGASTALFSPLPLTNMWWGAHLILPLLISLVYWRKRWMNSGRNSSIRSARTIRWRPRLRWAGARRAAKWSTLEAGKANSIDEGWSVLQNPELKKKHQLLNCSSVNWFMLWKLRDLEIAADMHFTPWLKFTVTIYLKFTFTAFTTATLQRQTWEVPRCSTALDNTGPHPDSLLFCAVTQIAGHQRAADVWPPAAASASRAGGSAAARQKLRAGARGSRRDSREPSAVRATGQATGRHRAGEAGDGEGWTGGATEPSRAEAYRERDNNWRSAASGERGGI